MRGQHLGDNNLNLFLQFSLGTYPPSCSRTVGRVLLKSEGPEVNLLRSRFKATFPNPSTMDPLGVTARHCAPLPATARHRPLIAIILEPPLESVYEGNLFFLASRTGLGRCGKIPSP